MVPVHTPYICTVNIAGSVGVDLDVHDNGGNGAKGQGQHRDGGAGSTASGGRCGRSGSGSGRLRGRLNISRTGQNVRLVGVA